MHTIERLQAYAQIKILADPRRLAILKYLMDTPSTLTQLGKVLGEHPAWVRHHLKLLEQAGLIELSEQKISGGYVEKYYRSVSSGYLLQQLLLPEKPGKSTIVISGSHDLALEMLAHLPAGDLYVFTYPIGSLDGLVSLRQGLCMAAGCHLYDTGSGDYNTPYVQHFFPDRKMTLITLAHREQGLVVAAGNPHQVKGLEDLDRPDLHIINRNRGSGTRLWLDEQLKRIGIPLEKVIGYANEVNTHTEVAEAIHENRAQVGLAIRAAAVSHNLGFIPLFHERYDLVISQEMLSQKQLAPLFDAFYSATFRQQVSSLGGYDITHLGDQIIL